MRYKVREVPSYESEDWNRLIYSSRQGTVYLLYEFSARWFTTDPLLSFVRLGCYDENNLLVAGLILPRRRLLGFWIDHLPRLPYFGTPVLSAEIQENSTATFDVLTALAHASRKYVLFMALECNPSLLDIRAYMQAGWSANRFYSHVWDLRNLDVIYENMGKRKKTIQKAQGEFLFAQEIADKVTDDFLKLYEKTALKYVLRFDQNWINSFRQQLAWLESKDLLRIYTLRSKTGELIGASSSILSRCNQTVYTWLLAYDYASSNRHYTPALYWYLAQDMATEFRYLDFGSADNFPLFSFKDSLATTSVPFWFLQTKRTEVRFRVGDALKKVRRTFTHSLHGGA